jgi:predicted NodU family carbamoyl transferase
MIDIAVHMAHDVNVTFYDHTSEKFYIFEAEKFYRDKNYRIDLYRYREEQFAIDLLEVAHDHFGLNLNNNVGTFIRGTIFSLDWVHPDFDDEVQEFWGGGSTGCMTKHVIKQYFNPKKIIFNEGHHKSHVRCAYHQSPFDRCVVFSIDGSGNDAYSGYGAWTVDNGEITRHDVAVPLDRSFLSAMNHGGQHRLDAGSYMGTKYSRYSNLLCDSICSNSWKCEESPGKVMGAEAFGRRPLVCHSTQTLADSYKSLQQFQNYYSHGKSFIQEMVGKIQKFVPEYDNIYVFAHDDSNKIDEQTMYDLAHQIQTEYRTTMKKVFVKNADLIKEYDNKVIITGGCGLNVTANRQMMEAFGVNIFVPPNTTDVGLSYGFMMEHLCKEYPKKYKKKKYDITYNGAPLWDVKDLWKHIDERNAEVITTQRIAKLLKKGFAIGFINGNYELGPRALGNRSILCDPAKPKTSIDKIKKRENYRPFAPICRLEDFDKHFEHTRNDCFQHMTVSAMVKEASKNRLKSVVHVDGSTRPQTVTRKQNPVVWDILTAFGAPLLNTSFNVKGSPTLNTFKEAFEVLDNQPLDAVVYWDQEEDLGYVFYKPGTQ